MGWISWSPLLLVAALWIPPATPICYDQVKLIGHLIRAVVSTEVCLRVKFISKIVDFDSTILFVEYANINICIPQSPFWFLTRPVVENLLDDEGRILSNKVE